MDKIKTFGQIYELLIQNSISDIKKNNKTKICLQFLIPVCVCIITDIIPPAASVQAWAPGTWRRGTPGDTESSSQYACYQGWYYHGLTSWFYTVHSENKSMRCSLFVLLLITPGYT